MSEWSDKSIMIGTAIIGIILVGILVVIDCKRQADWIQFQKDHVCNKIGERAGYTTYLNKGGIYHPRKNIYLCDDGIQYTK